MFNPRHFILYVTLGSLGGAIVNFVLYASPLVALASVGIVLVLANFLAVYFWRDNDQMD